MPEEMSQFAKDILEGLNNAIAYACGKPTPRTIVHVIMITNVKAIRRSLRMSQEAFARAYRIPVTTLKDWERGRRQPDATVSAYLRVIERYPKEVERALAGQ